MRPSSAGATSFRGNVTDAPIGACVLAIVQNQRFVGEVLKKTDGQFRIKLRNGTQKWVNLRELHTVAVIGKDGITTLDEAFAKCEAWLADVPAAGSARPQPIQDPKVVLATAANTVASDLPSEVADLRKAREATVQAAEDREAFNRARHNSALLPPSATSSATASTVELLEALGQEASRVRLAAMPLTEVVAVSTSLTAEEWDKLSWQERASAVEQHNNRAKVKAIELAKVLDKAVFRVLDADQSGTIELGELISQLEKLGDGGEAPSDAVRQLRRTVLDATAEENATTTATAAAAAPTTADAAEPPPLQRSASGVSMSPADWRTAWAVFRKRGEGLTPTDLLGATTTAQQWPQGTGNVPSVLRSAARAALPPNEFQRMSELERFVFMRHVALASNASSVDQASWASQLHAIRERAASAADETLDELVFAAIDADGNGSISRDELKALLASAGDGVGGVGGGTEEAADLLFRWLDADGDGSISRAEWREGYSHFLSLVDAASAGETAALEAAAAEEAAAEKAAEEAARAEAEATPQPFEPPPMSRQPSDSPSRPHPSGAVDVSLTTCPNLSSKLTLATITPPQTNGIDVQPTSGAHCLVLDVSYSMEDDAKVTNDDGDKVSHGWSLLDIVKHASCTYVQSLGASDFVCIVTYASEARIDAQWTACTEDGKKALDATIRGLTCRGATNLTEGITLGMGQFGALPAPVQAAPHEYSMQLVVCTDGCPSANTHPPGGESGYAKLTDGLRGTVEEAHGPTAVPTVTAIGFGNSLDSRLLHSFSEVFLHIPDPGSVGPFIVNLLAAARSTAKLQPPSGGPIAAVTANHARLILEPASKVGAVHGHRMVPWRNGAAVAVDLGSLLYDGPRHLLIAASEAITATLEVSGFEIATSKGIAPADSVGAFKAQVDRSAFVCAVQAVQPASAGSRSVETPSINMLSLLATALPEGPLKQTIETEVLLGVQPDKFRTWGRHYVMTLPGMLRLERRSNFRDVCLQNFGKDKLGREALFETLSNDAETAFATLKPPEPSKLRRPASSSSVSRGGGGGGGGGMSALPPEFMRGGGCFGPDATVLIEGGQRVKVGDVRSGMRLVGEGGRLARVVCVVLTECAGGRAQLTRLSNGLELTEWHPVRIGDGSGGNGSKWRFPLMVGSRIVRAAAYVYNFVLEPGHPTILVDHVPCAALGHGLTDRVVAHPYWGTRAVIDDLATREGWEAGRVVLHAE